MQQYGKCKIRVWTSLAFNGNKSEWGLGKGFQRTRCFLEVRKRYLDLKKKKNPWKKISEIGTLFSKIHELSHGKLEGRIMCRVAADKDEQAEAVHQRSVGTKPRTRACS